MRLFTNQKRLPVRPGGATRKATRLVASLPGAPFLLFLALFAGLWPVSSASAQNQRAVEMTPISDRNSESDVQGTRPGPLPSFQVNLRNADTGGILLTPTDNVLVTLVVENRPIAGATAPGSDPEALIATNAQPIFREQQTLLFTPQNYSQPQTVFVQGQDDALEDGDQPFRVRVESVTSGDSQYNNLGTAAPGGPGGTGVNQFVSGVNTDNEADPGQDRAAVKIVNLGSDALTDVVTNENGARATVSVVLTKAPTSDVTINFRTNDPTEGRILDLGSLVDSTSLVFSADPAASNAWNVPQLVTIQGIDDTLVDGDVGYRIITTMANTTTDPDYAAIDPADIIATNNDNEVYGLTISPSFVVVYEGQTSTLSVVLDRAPNRTVRFSLSVDKPTEVRLNRSELVFEPSNFNVPQTVVVSGVRDNIIDGDKPFVITVGNAVSSDLNYNNKFGTTIDGQVIDIDTARINIQPPGGLETTEAGGTATFQVSLASMPQNNTTVTLNLSSSDTTEGTVAPATLTFDQSNWNQARTVTITGRDDLLNDGDQDYQINITVAGGAGSDPDYSLLELQPVTVVNRDSGETPGVVVTPNTDLSTFERGSAGPAQTINVSLNAQPTDNVVLQLRSSDTTEGVVSPARLTFTSTNFATPQAVTITGRDDAVADGNVQYQIILDPLTSNDPKYRFDPADLTVTNFDDETVGITVTPSSNNMETTESGGTATFNVRLQSQPTDIVTLNMVTAAGREISLSPSQVIFTPNTPAAGSGANRVRWDLGIDVTVTGLDDPIVDGNKPWSIDLRPLVSNDPLYDGVDPANVRGENLDDETANLFFSPRILVTTEGQGTQFTARLTSKPAFNVRFALSVTDVGSTAPSDEVRLSQNFLLFTPDDYDQPHNIVLTGVRDFLRDGDQDFELNIAPAVSSDPVYSGNLGDVVPGTNIDVDIPGITVTPANRRLETSERGGTDSFTVVLNARPQAGRTVTLRIASSNRQEGTPSPSALTFNSTNWNVPQTVTVTGVNDLVEDGDKPYQILLNVDSAVGTADPDFNFVSQPPLNAINRDNEKPGVNVAPSTGLTTTEAAPGTTTFTVSLNSPPASNVTLQLRSSNPREGRLRDPATNQLDTDNIVVLTFTPANFNTARRITVQGVDDNIADGNVNYRIDITVTSGDARYNRLAVPAVRLTNIDDDVSGVIVTPTNGLTVSESGTTDTFTVQLRSQPTANVVLGLQSFNADEARTAITTITFSPGGPAQPNNATQRFARWDRPVTVTVQGVRDNTSDGTQPFTIVTQPLQSTDSVYSGLNPADVRGTTTDTDVPSLIITPPSTGVATSENRTRSRIRISLGTRPTDTVTIPLSVSDTTEAAIIDPVTNRADTDNQVSLVFRPSDWPASGATPLAKEIFVEGVDDRLEDGTIVYQVLIGRPVSTDRNYSGLAAQNVQGTNADNDDRTAPTVTITTPGNGATVNSLSTITGTADDPASATTGVTTGIKKVEVFLFRFGSGYYNRNGGFDATFDPAKHLLPATYDEQTKLWTLDIPALTATTPSLRSGRYFARARATDKGDSTFGNTSNVRDSERVDFTVDTSAPLAAELKLILPEQGGVYTTLTQASGTARDDAAGSGIQRVRIVLFRYANATTGLPAGYLSNDGTFVDGRTLVDAAGTTDANGVFNFTFDFTPPLEPGRYFIQAFAEDKAGNEINTPRIFFTMRNTAGGPDDFIVGQTYLISLPYMDSNGRAATTTPDRAFNVEMIDPVTREQRYQINRFDPLTQSYVLLQPTDTLRRGEGYFIKPLTTSVRILRPGDDPTRLGLAESVTTFAVTLRRNPSANPSDPNNGFNLMGDPFKPERYLAADWVNATVVEPNGTTYTTVAAAAAAGVIDSRLFTFDPATGGYQPITGSMEPFKGYFVKTFKDNVRVTLKAVDNLP